MDTSIVNQEFQYYNQEGQVIQGQVIQGQVIQGQVFQGQVIKVQDESEVGEQQKVIDDLFHELPSANPSNIITVYRYFLLLMGFSKMTLCDLGFLMQFHAS